MRKHFVKPTFSGYLEFHVKNHSYRCLKTGQDVWLCRQRCTNNTLFPFGYIYFILIWLLWPALMKLPFWAVCVSVIALTLLWDVGSYLLACCNLFGQLRLCEREVAILKSTEAKKPRRTMRSFLRLVTTGYLQVTRHDAPGYLVGKVNRFCLLFVTVLWACFFPVNMYLTAGSFFEIFHDPELMSMALVGLVCFPLLYFLFVFFRPRKWYEQEVDDAVTVEFID